MKMNLGCGPDIKDGWVNVDNYYDPENKDRTVWDMRGGPFGQWVEAFDFVLVNHTFCLLSYDDGDIALKNILEVLKPGGVLQVVDMDVMKAVDSYHKNDFEGLPGFEGSIDNAFCKHLIGFGRKSVYTSDLMQEKLLRAGFKSLVDIKTSEYDKRPKESLVVEGTK